ncbi:MAG: hypothetical protein WB699_00760 [Bacteroidota bacterium]
MMRKGFGGFLKGQSEVDAQKRRKLGVILDKEKWPVYIPSTINDLPDQSEYLIESLTVLPQRR